MITVPTLRPEQFAVSVDRIGGAQTYDAELDAAVCALAVERGTLTGYDNLSAEPTAFAVRSQTFREDLLSSRTGSFARQRLMICGLAMAIAYDVAAPLPVVAERMRRLEATCLLAESDSVVARRMRSCIPPGLLTVSEYFPDAGSPGAGVLHVDLQAAPFADGTFDVVMTSDVMEHVPLATVAEREIIRILRSGGAYVFTAPFNPTMDEDEVRAELVDGKIVHHAEPIYHDDPLRPEGALVYRIFSHPGMQRRFVALGCTFETYRIWSKTLGIIGDNCWLHLVRKP